MTSGEDEDDEGTLLSSATVSKFERHFRCVIADEMMREGGQQGSEFRKIGGLNLTVEIDESLFGKRLAHPQKLRSNLTLNSLIVESTTGAE